MTRPELEQKNTNETTDESPVRELDEQALLEALQETSVGTAGALQIEYKETRI